jgi:triacylglycerol lipase
MSIRTLVLVTTLLAAGAAMADAPPDLAAKNKAIGQKVDPAASAAIYGPLQPKEPYSVPGLQVSRDVAYGPGPLEKLDVFSTARKPGEALKPVLIFVHGGGFVGGDKGPVTNGVHSQFYDNVMLWAVQHGIVGININYDLAPKATYPVVQKQIGAAIAWAKKNAAQHGGDPNRIYLMGHSAGGSHAAAYVGTPEAYPAGGVGLKGLIVSSGTADAFSSAGNPYFVPADRYGKLDFVPALTASKLPILVFRAEYDPDWAIGAFNRFQSETAKAAVKPEFHVNKGHGHMSESYSIGTGDTTVSGPLEAFVKRR